MFLFLSILLLTGMTTPASSQTDNDSTVGGEPDVEVCLPDDSIQPR
jgi:hypothetical protein